MYSCTTSSYGGHPGNDVRPVRRHIPRQARPLTRSTLLLAKWFCWRRKSQGAGLSLIQPVTNSMFDYPGIKNREVTTWRALQAPIRALRTPHMTSKNFKTSDSVAGGPEEAQQSWLERGAAAARSEMRSAPEFLPGWRALGWA